MPDAHDKNYLNTLLKTPSPNFTAKEIKKFANKLYGLTGKLSPLDSERDQNSRLITKKRGEFVIKIANSAEDLGIIDMQIKALEHIALTNPDLPVPRVMRSLKKLTIEQIQAENGTKHYIRVLTYLQGTPPKDNPTEQALLRPIGERLAQLTLALRGFFHPKANYEILWDLKHTSKLRQYLSHVTDPDHHKLVNYFIDRFDQNVLPEIPKLRAQILHNDLTPDNIVVSEHDPGDIVGIIDFGDMTHTLIIIDLATTIASMVREHKAPVNVAVEIISEYHKLIPLETAELRTLYDLIAARLVMLNVIAVWRVTLHPENRAYITGGVEETWGTLKAWRALDPVEVTRRFFRACGYWEFDEGKPQQEKVRETRQTHLLRRNRLLGSCAYLFYDHPLHITRGEGAWLYDIDGNRYLDAYNNVAHVGHSHPHVVNAITKQAHKLNTSTRYMHGLILELAERITAKMPDTLSVCMFVCTGSEANELAWQMSQLASGNHGALVTQYAYHGSSAATMQFSPESISQYSLPTHVQTLLAPTSDTTFQKPNSGLDDAISALDEQGHKPAMLLLDTSFVSDGVYTSPKGYLNTLFTKTRAAGGLFVADEVQGGFGRFGQHFWGFKFDEVIPDIVTMGKPMGNGHPIAAVVTRPEIAETLAKKTGYFNTFGGNPVSCAAALAVLEVIEKEDLQRNALEVGQYLKEQLDILRNDYPMIGDIHGTGLLQGIDIIKPDGAPDPKLADRLMNRMREKGVLIGTTGEHYSILKIRPPIVFQNEHADILLAALKNAMDGENQIN
ncbi:MAG: aminotransferase class III-fold pyridoxal phosphate-dependent enzyme [Chloroflexi bacterium]|nr:aminotransferase class III-fold pyridoxal phosphate-dependent enzyme [Chloroflexota bacterium]